MGVCTPPVVRSSLVLTVHHLHSMAVFNSLLIKRIYILFAVFPASRLQINFPAELLSQPFLQFYVTLIVNLQIARWITWPSILCSDCVTDSRDMCPAHLHSPSLAHGIFPVVLWYNMKVGVAQRHPKGVWVVGLIPCWESLARKREWITSQMHQWKDFFKQRHSAPTGCTGYLSGVKVSMWSRLSIGIDRKKDPQQIFPSGKKRTTREYMQHTSQQVSHQCSRQIILCSWLRQMLFRVYIITVDMGKWLYRRCSILLNTRNELCGIHIT